MVDPGVRCPAVLVDLAINPFDADVGDMVRVAQRAEDAGASAVWVADHFSGAVVGRRWSRDPFVCLGAIAASTARVDLGILVANIVNRHPAQLAAAVDSLRSLAPGRIRLGVGSGAAPGSRFAVEHEAIGRVLGSADERRALLVDHLLALRAIWRHESDFESDSIRWSGLTGVVDDRSVRPQVVVGASAWPTVEVALAHADGVNLRRTAALDDHLARLADAAPAGFEVSVLDTPDGLCDGSWSVRQPHVGRLIVGVSAPFDLDAIGPLVDAGSAV